MSNRTATGRRLRMQISVETGAVFVRWPLLNLTMVVDPDRAWWLLRGCVFHRVDVAQC
jgi:hypothetical protein